MSASLNTLLHWTPCHDTVRSVTTSANYHLHLHRVASHQDRASARNFRRLYCSSACTRLHHGMIYSTMNWLHCTIPYPVTSAIPCPALLALPYLVLRCPPCHISSAYYYAHKASPKIFRPHHFFAVRLKDRMNKLIIEWLAEWCMFYLLGVPFKWPIHWSSGGLNCCFAPCLIIPPPPRDIDWCVVLCLQLIGGL